MKFGELLNSYKTIDNTYSSLAGISLLSGIKQILETPLDIRNPEESKGVDREKRIKSFIDFILQDDTEEWKGDLEDKVKPMTIFEAADILFAAKDKEISDLTHVEKIDIQKSLVVIRSFYLDNANDCAAASERSARPEVMDKNAERTMEICGGESKDDKSGFRNYSGALRMAAMKSKMDEAMASKYAQLVEFCDKVAGKIGVNLSSARVRGEGQE